VGATLAEAAAPRYLETPAGRVALIAASSSFHETDRAGAQRFDQRGRPGLNPLRHIPTYHLPREALATLAATADSCGINAAQKMRAKAGFARPLEDGVVAFGQYRFREGPAGLSTEPHPGDLARLKASIGEARRQADFVLVSLHAHEQRGEDLDRPAEFVETACRAFIEAGADAVLGHGPHVLRGIELHQGRPIFYSLGNFFFQNETVENLPADYFEAFGLAQDASTADGLDARTANNTRGFITNPWIWKSVLARLSLEDGRLTGCELHAVAIDAAHRARRGTPRLAAEPDTLAHIAELSAPYGTRLDISGGVARLRLG
jgi:poly-gamma-glutamate synthesis protein (capsule biosynthesis protein)